MDEKKENMRLFKYGLTAFAVIVAAMLAYFVIFHFEAIKTIFADAADILAPITSGFVIAYLLLPVYNACTEWIGKHFSKARKTEKGRKRAEVFARVTATVVSILLLLAVVASFLWLVLPELYRSVRAIAIGAPSTMNEIVDWAERILAKYPEIEENVTELIESFFGDAVDLANKYILPYLENLVNGVSSSIVSTLVGTFVFIKNILIGLIAAIYMLNIKETVAGQAKKLIYSVFPLRHANVIIENVRFTHRTFGGFISGKLLDSLIIGIICFIGMSVLRIPFATLVSVIVGVTNVIPFFGPFIGAIPSALLILTVDWLQCIYFIVFVLILQQLDGNVIGPKILGGTTGLPSFWVMFAIITFSGIMGFLGMIVGVPVLAVVFNIIGALCKRSLEKKNLPVASESYRGIGGFDPQTHEPFESEEQISPRREARQRRIQLRRLRRDIERAKKKTEETVQK